MHETQRSSDWVLRFLLERGVLSRAEAARAAPAAEDVSVSHRSFVIRVGGEPRWFVKCADAVRSHGRHLGTEAAVYRLAADNAVLQSVLPRCWTIGDADEVLVLDALPGEPLSAMTWASRGHALRKAALYEYGATVALVNSVPAPALGEPPWLLTAFEPEWGHYDWLPPSCARVLVLLARTRGARDGFRRARDQWQPTALVHGDVRWANAIFDPASSTTRLWIVDWELACRGDAAWDLGSLIADVVAAYALGWPGFADEDPLTAVAPLMRGYHDGAAYDDEAWRGLLQRSVRLAGVRVVQTLLEHSFTAPATPADAEAALVPWSLALVQDNGRIMTAINNAMHSYS